MAKISDRTRGAWVISHSRKLEQVDAQGQFSSIETAGKFGRLLSLLAASDKQDISRAQLITLARANGLNPKLELDALLTKMEERYLIKSSKEGNISVLGITHGTVLERAAEVFDSLSPEDDEKAVIGIAEQVSQAPLRSGEMSEYVSDTYKIKKQRTAELLEQAEDIGFIDAQELDKTTKERLYFNGNIFRITNAEKTLKVLNSLTAEEVRKVKEVEQTVAQRGFSTVEDAQKILGAQLFTKLQAIALFDVNRVANDAEEVLYITRPASFSKYGNPWEEDTLDYAKALVSSLAYGMTRSGAGRGKIIMLQRLLEKLVRGEWLNENSAAGEDYKYLELKRVVETRRGAYAYNMRLLKKEVGVVALEVLTQGTGSSESLLERLPGSSVSTYRGPEENRTELRRKKLVAPSDMKLAAMLESLRTGKLG
ncbi:hypothetical protein [Myxococcus xanthus]|uniref:hypothetical protein n=1 Tax=Myxococcus xanthus TaxID=34 RepID=UPI001127DF7B|nr:hypothetical protein [Myxococcus xanthus]